MITGIRNLNIWKVTNEKEEKKGSSSYLFRDISCLELSNRSYNVLRRGGYQMVGDVIKLTNTDDLRNVCQLGQKSEQEIREKLELYIKFCQK